MKHQIKFISFPQISEYGTQVIIDHVHQLRGEVSQIHDPSVQEMINDFAEASRKKGAHSLQQMEKAKSLRDVEGLSNADMARIVVQLQTKDDTTETENRSGTTRPSVQEQQEFNQYRHHQYVKRWGLFSEAEGRDEEWFIPSPDILNEDHPEYLCDMCRHIDFDVLLTKRGLPGNHRPGPTRIILHALDKVLQGTNCSFCSLIRRKIEDDKLLPSGYVPIETESFHLNVLDDGPEYAARLEVELDSPGRGHGSIRIVMQRLADSNPKPLQGLTVQKDRVDWERLNSWFRTCEETHVQSDEHCRWYSALIDDATALRVVEVEQNRICMIEKPSRYACLSYVWGKGTQTQYTAQTKDMLESPQGLMNGSANLPQTIKDAMHVTKQLGLRYIWIDSLCIRQDDANDKAHIISKMGAIYGNAAITLVAATNSDPTGGLNGAGPVCRKRSQIIEKLQGMTIGVAFHDPRTPFAEVETSVWCSRAWTFQERLLSQRTVYFTESQMMFACPHAQFFEDTLPVLTPGYKPTPSVEQTKSTARINDVIMRIWTDPTQGKFPNKSFLADNETMDYWAEDPASPDSVCSNPAPVYMFTDAPASDQTGFLQFEGRTLWDVYNQAVDNYTQRKMTWASDAVSAFSGVAAFIQSSANTKFWHGLPEFAFDQSLLWRPREPLKRRMKEGRPLFPSWTWVAWEGHSSYHGRGWYNALSHPPVPVIKWVPRVDVGVLVDKFKKGSERSEEEIEKFRQSCMQNRVIPLCDPYTLSHLANIDQGWVAERNEATNEHFYKHAAYPGIRFIYPITLPGQNIIERPFTQDTLRIYARITLAIFCDVGVAGFIQEPSQQSYLQIGINDEKRSSNARPSWQRIIYHQGYRAGYLTMNVPFEEIDCAAKGQYALVAMSRDSLPRIAPPGEGWDLYWTCEPRMIHSSILREEFQNKQNGDSLLVPPPTTDVAPDIGPDNEYGDPHWDEKRFGRPGLADVYNVILLRRLDGAFERIGVGKINYKAFHHAQPVWDIITIK